MYEIFAYCPLRYPSYRDADSAGDSYYKTIERASDFYFLEGDIKNSLGLTKICVVVLKDGEFIDTTYLT